MQHSFLSQQRFSALDGKQFADALEIFLATYAEIILGFIFIVLICAAGLALLEARQRRAPRHSFASQPQKRQPGRRHQPFANRCERFSLEHDSIF